MNLPDPEDILKDPRSLVLPDRTDRAYAVCYSLVGAVLNNKTPERWEAAMIALGVAGAKNADIPDRGGAHAVRQAQPPRRAPSSCRDECRPFYELMQAAKLVPTGREPMLSQLADLIRGLDRRGDGYSRALQAARVRASYQRAYFAPALFNLIPVKTDLIAQHGRRCLLAPLLQRVMGGGAHASKRTRPLLIHEVSHLLRDHEARKQGRGRSGQHALEHGGRLRDQRRPRSRGPAAARRPTAAGRSGCHRARTPRLYYRQAAIGVPQPDEGCQRDRRQLAAAAMHDCGSGAHGERRPWELAR